MDVITKAAIIEDEDNLPKLWVCSMYYTKPIHLVRKFSDNITRPTKKGG